MITRKTLTKFGCHAEAVEEFAREAGLKVEPDTTSTFSLGMRVKDSTGRYGILWSYEGPLYARIMYDYWRSNPQLSEILLRTEIIPVLGYVPAT